MLLFLGHMKPSNVSEYYSDGLRKTLNPDYAPTPCFQHAVVSVDGKLIPFACPSVTKSPKLYHHILPHDATVNENGTIRFNINPMSHLDNDNIQENFYHTVSPFSLHNQYEECRSHTCLYNQTGM